MMRGKKTASPKNKIEQMAGKRKRRIGECVQDRATRTTVRINGHLLSLRAVTRVTENGGLENGIFRKDLVATLVEDHGFNKKKALQEICGQ